MDIRRNRIRHGVATLLVNGDIPHDLEHVVEWGQAGRGYLGSFRGCCPVRRALLAAAKLW